MASPRRESIRGTCCAHEFRRRSAHEEVPVEFTDVVMKRRAVRRFEEGGVAPEVIERIARLAQRTPSAGFSQGQRLVVVADPARRKAARSCDEDDYQDVDSGRGSASAPRSSSRASARRSTTAATRRRTRSTRTAWRSTGRSRSGGSTSAPRCRTSCSRRWTRAWAAGSSGRRLDAIREFLGIPDEFTPIGVMPVGRPLPDVRSPSLKRGWVPFEQFARWDRWE